MKKNIGCFVMVYSLLLLSATLFSNPKISIITSVYKGDLFIEGFLADIVRQTIFNQCELILINANSPGNEEPIIKKYMQTYPNIIYKRLDKDPGIYGTWNIAISISKGQYITNANLDDRLSPKCYQVHSTELDANKDIMLVYSDRYYTYTPNETFEKHSGKEWPTETPFSKYSSHRCLPRNNPMWRKNLHEKFGLFDASYKYSGDWEMWQRASEGGAQFKKVNGRYSLYFVNPQGLSTSKEFASGKELEDIKIIIRYSYRWEGLIYQEYYQLACMLDKASNSEQKAWPLALAFYLKAFNLCPLRAEPLVRIAHHYRSINDNALAYFFANHACDLDYTKDPDIDQEIYRYIRYDILGITAWYVGQYEKGEAAARKALEAYPDDKRLQENLKFYIDRKNSQHLIK